ncbi:MAG: hypothetical protein NZ108_09290 [Bacteroidia bacterium]|nr:hypothetical protein [Bacteroidia bacterium]
MPIKSILISCLLIGLFGCNQGKEEIAKIQALENQMKEKLSQAAKGSSVMPDTNQCLELALAYEQFNQKYSSSDSCPVYWMRAGELYFNCIDAPSRAIYCFETVYQKYPTAPDAPAALFTTAYISANVLNDTKRAAALYSEFMQKFPKHELFQSAEMEFKNLGKLETFEK